MLDLFRRRLGSLVARVRMRGLRDPVISFRNAFAEARSVLLIMPFDPAPPPSLAAITDLLRGHLPQESITIVTAGHSFEVGRLLPRSTLIRFPESDLGTFFVPRAAALGAVTARQYDIAIDLNLDFVLPSGYIAKASGSRVRVGFARPDAERFFNVVIQRKTELPRDQVYDRLAQFLRKF